MILLDLSLIIEKGKKPSNVLIFSSDNEKGKLMEKVGYRKDKDYSTWLKCVILIFSKLRRRRKEFIVCVYLSVRKIIYYKSTERERDKEMV